MNPSVVHVPGIAMPLYPLCAPAGALPMRSEYGTKKTFLFKTPTERKFHVSFPAISDRCAFYFLSLSSCYEGERGDGPKESKEEAMNGMASLCWLGSDDLLSENSHSSRRSVWKSLVSRACD